jgi:ammonia channel protein AmtB
VLPIAGVPIGILVGISAFYGGMLVKQKIRLDDTLDVTALQAFPGAVGSILVGFFATTDAYVYNSLVMCGVNVCMLCISSSV